MCPPLDLGNVRTRTNSLSPAGNAVKSALTEERNLNPFMIIERVLVLKMTLA
jgi:hypothetical protein